MEEQIKEVFRQTEVFLIGIGEEMSPVLPDEERDPMVPEAYSKSAYYAMLPPDHPMIAVYRRLAEVIGDRPWFAVTMNTDDLIFRSSLSADRIVAPCGSLSKMQCREHITDAGPIREKVLSEKNTEFARCPLCGEPLEFHTIQTERYLEEGYLPQWKNYTKFLQKTLNRRLCVLELGVGFRYPQVIRFPFEKTVFYNQKAKLIRVNSHFPQLPAELSGKGISVCESPVDFLLRY